MEWEREGDGEFVIEGERVGRERERESKSGGSADARKEGLGAGVLLGIL